MMENSSKHVILFDYQQKALPESSKGDFLHSYALANEFTKYFVLYGLKPYSDPDIINKETNVLFAGKKYFKFAQSIINPLYQAVCILKKNIKFDLIYYRYNSILISQISCLLSIIFKKPMIIEIGGVPWEEKKGVRSLMILRKIYLLPLKYADKIIFYSKSIQDEILKYLKIDAKKILIIPCGVDETRIVVKDKINIRTKLGFDIYTKIVTFAGSVDKWQGLDIAIEAIRKLKEEKYLNYLLIIVGGGKELSNLKELVRKYSLEEYVIFKGKVSNETALEFISLSDVCIAPFRSYRKASPLKIFEYGALGKITISSDIPDVRRLGLDDNIIYFTPDSSDSLYKVLKDCYIPSNIDEQDKIRERVISKYSWKIITNEIINNVINPFFSERR